MDIRDEFEEIPSKRSCDIPLTPVTSLRSPDVPPQSSMCGNHTSFNFLLLAYPSLKLPSQLRRHTMLIGQLLRDVCKYVSSLPVERAADEPTDE